MFGLLKAQRAQAHCDIPCGIYDPITAKIAAQTAQKMVARIQALAKPAANADANTWSTYEATLARYVAVKEEHAETCKKELRILWADYFRPEHVQKYPNLHTDFWNAQKLAGQVKQKVDADLAKQLVESVDKIAATFWETKNVKYADPNAAVRYGT
ncbi:MAG: superoxide dismutase, Ni [SAR202 cluster bacterium]|nr:superoxide dismutase, Ni [SAR202 cluster bacterium]